MKKKMNSIMTIVFATFLLFGVVQSAMAKFWGWEKDPAGTTDWADGPCLYRQTCSTYYVFWIAVEDRCTTETIVCSGQE